MVGAIQLNSIVSVSGDIHINLRDVDTKLWEVGRVLQLFTTLANDSSNIVILSGDIFDKANATLEEIGLFYEGLELLQDKRVYIIEGNHEELSEYETTFKFLPSGKYTLVQSDYLVHPTSYIWLVGHPHIHPLVKDNFPIMKDKKNILISHYRSDIGFAKEEISNEIISDKFTNTILSDIHYRLYPAENIRYTSSPYGIHFSPKKEYGYTQIYFSKNGFEIKDITLDLPSKIKVTTSSDKLEDTLKSLSDKHLYKLEITGEVSSLMLGMLAEAPNVYKFSFEELEDTVEDIAEELLVSMGNSVEDLLVVALGDLSLSEEELNRAKAIIKEEI